MDDFDIVELRQATRSLTVDLHKAIKEFENFIEEIEYAQTQDEQEVEQEAFFENCSVHSS